jgi:NAD(P)-dependent dehydrogenase (short-subunit alcohol dehydrogenase family)
MKNYLIIGGSSGIGLASSKLLAKNGHNVYASYNSTLPPAQDSGISYFKYNVLDDENTFDHLPDKIDGLVYCPGVINLKPFHRITPETFRQDYELQLIGAVKVIQAVLPKLKTAETSSVVLFSTIAVQTGFNFHSLVSASKGAIEGFTRALAAEFAPKIRVNCIAPSLTDTPLANRLLNTPEKIAGNAERHRLKRTGEASDMANAVNFLLGDDSGWITGQVLKIDGGLSAIKT